MKTFEVPSSARAAVAIVDLPEGGLTIAPLTPTTPVNHLRLFWGAFQGTLESLLGTERGRTLFLMIINRLKESQSPLSDVHRILQDFRSLEVEEEIDRLMSDVLLARAKKAESALAEQERLANMPSCSPELFLRERKEAAE